MYYDKFKERENKNKFCTADQIDERQALELFGLLDRWQKGEIDPCDVILEASHITGANAEFLTSYNHMKELIEAPADELKIMLQIPHIDEAEFQEIKQQSISELDKRRKELRKLFRPEILNPDADITQNIKAIQDKLEDCDFSSWEAAIAIAEVILDPTIDEEDPSQHPLDDFKESIERERQYCSRFKKDINKTIEAFRAETEEEIKKPLAHLFAKERAYKIWEEEGNAKKSEKYWCKPTRERFENWGCPGAPNEDEEIEFIHNIDFPDYALCDEVHIAPSGTGLIEVYERDEYTQSFERDICGEDVARITTYSVSFVPKNPDDLESLKGFVEKALAVLGRVPYKYDLPGSTPSGKSYKRPENDFANYHEDPYTISNSYIHTKDGKVMPQMRFDLDDLWTLYYILEPIIEPSEQVAIAMNVARQAEERGSILESDDFDYVHKGHHVADESGYLKKGNLEEMLQNALCDIFTKFAIDEIDEAEFSAKMSTLANHTLSGQIIAPNNSLPTYAQMIDTQNEDGNTITTFEDALKHRTHALMRYVAGSPQDSDEPLLSALISAKQKLGEPLKEKFRANSQEKDKALIEARYKRNIQKRGNDVFAELRELAKDRQKSFELTDIFAGKKPMTDEEYRKKVANDIDGGALTNVTNLVVSDSAVETCLDGVHAGGRYISRTRNSIFVRKELPSALKPFATSNDNEASTQLALGRLDDIFEI